MPFQIQTKLLWYLLVTDFCCDLWFLLLLVPAKSKTPLTFAAKVVFLIKWRNFFNLSISKFIWLGLKRTKSWSMVSVSSSVISKHHDYESKSQLEKHICIWKVHIQLFGLLSNALRFLKHIQLLMSTHISYTTMLLESTLYLVWLFCKLSFKFLRVGFYGFIFLASYRI